MFVQSKNYFIRTNTFCPHEFTQEVRLGRGKTTTHFVLNLPLPPQTNVLKIAVTISSSISHKLQVFHESKSIIFQEDFTLTISGTWPKTAKDVQMVLMFHLIEHQENQCWIVKLVHKVNCLRSYLVLCKPLKLVLCTSVYSLFKNSLSVGKLFQGK